MLTEKENYLMCLRGEQPEWVPRYTMFQIPGQAPVASIILAPGLLSQYRRVGGKDVWGVNYVRTYEAGNAQIPEPNNFILKDIRKWRDVIKAPSLEGIDWEDMVKKDLEYYKVDRSQTAVALNMQVGFFQNLMAFMGFTEGLMAFHEEPEEVKALLNYLCDFYVAVQSKYVDILKPDVIATMDDTATWAAPFISPEMYREFILPFHDRQVKVGRDRGLPISMHNCGKSEAFFDDLVKIGVCVWDPCQTSNDVVGIKKKYGNKLIIAGGWDARGRLLEPDTTEEEIYESVRSTMNLLATGGGYAFSGQFLGPMDDPVTRRKNGILSKAIKELGHAFYN
ncbi:putative veratrol:corrinoid protein metyltransferase [Treponema primitia ZAS-2]|uniref:Putative veratrol:corrinoid protein metyltransferase n=1 Tax=Treponema primitia (strain ATCC BAA-887 / DSM 12427 / ZAS-2) TaxID=545694 RepID=F5YPE4_TREPZ|nr:veratrol--corrinoid protein metyltransferase [Treponema primitia]AEF86821.1 putative veratrol:corrinoid protein metyltransferase [Treponema primitia ZAS-2]